MQNLLLFPELKAMLIENDEVGLRAFMEELHPATIAESSEALSVEATWRLLDLAPLERQAEVLVCYPTSKQVELTQAATPEHMAKLLEAMAADDRVDLLQRLDERLVDKVLRTVAKSERQNIRMLLEYHENSAGAMMTTEYSWLLEDITVAEALTQLRRQATESETIYYVYILDAERRLQGLVTLRDLVLASAGTRLSEIMERSVVSVRVDDNREMVSQIIAQYDFIAVPVVDGQNRLVGIVTHDDAIDAVVEEATIDALQLGGVGAIVDNYLQVPYRVLWKKRAVWLACLFVAELFTFTALAYFEDAIATVVALSLFVPLCISTGGNSGSQAATLITRAMALGHVTPADWVRVLRHEIILGIALGLTLGVVGFARAAATPQSILGGVDRWMLALVISQVVAIICLWGTLVGSLLPLIFKRAGVDPGYASSPFVATFVDVTGIVIYFSIAKFWLF